MASESVGQIGLDLVVNDRSFKKQMLDIQGMAKKAGLALAAAFSVKKLVDFGKECVELGSDLAEVQNVVDVTFPQMSKQIDSFAKNAAVQFGLSETMAKKFTGTFGAMSKAFGFGEQQAYEMATALTGLAGDVASFYNISQDEAYTKLKSVFTGETESLKDLGIVMTQTALDSYAMADGFGKATANMSEMEKVALRYQFVQDQLSLAAGDFSRTSDGWANQIRILKLQFDSLKATIGQGLINVLTPVIKVINTIIGKLMSLANAFKAFTEMLTGKKSGGGASAAASGMEAVAKTADKAGNAVSGTGSAAKKAAEELKGVTTGIDELNIISPPDESGSGSGSSPGGYGADSFDMGEADTSALDEMDNKYQKLIDRMKELAGLVKQGFWDGFGDTSVFDSIQNSIDSIQQSLKDIFTSSEVVSAANRFADSVAYNLGKVAGSVASIGATIADNLLGGIALYLEQNAPRIKEYLVSMFDIASRRAEIYGNFYAAVADIFTVFRSDSAKQITANIIAIFANGFMGVRQFAASFGTDFLDLITAPVINNSGKFKEAFNGILDAFQVCTGAVSGIVSETVDKLLQLYDEHVHPLFVSLRDGLSEIVGAALDAFNSNILPVLQNAAQKFKEFSETALQPLIDKFLEFSGKAIDAIKLLWETVLQPFILWFVQNAAPIISSILEALAEAFFTFAEEIAEIINGVLTVLNGVLDFLLGAFTGDWKRAWEGVKEILSGIWELIKSLIAVAVETIVSVINLAWTAISGTTEFVFNGIKAFLTTVFNEIKTVISTIIRSIQTVISTTLAKIQSNWEKVWSDIKTYVSDKINEVKTGIAGTLKDIKSDWDEKWGEVKSKVTGIFDNIKDYITGKETSKMESIESGIGGTLEDIKSNWGTVWEEVKTTTTNIFGGIWDVIKGTINSIIGGVESMANGVIKGFNAMINALNKLSFEVPDWVPEIGGGKFGFSIPTLNTISIPKLPELAEGGYVRANTPQLAMIGDNRRYGEIVAPEDKMQEMVDRAVSIARGSSGMSDQYLAVVVELLRKIIELIENLDLTVNIDIREIKKKLTDLENRSGYRIKTT